MIRLRTYLHEYEHRWSQALLHQLPNGQQLAVLSTYEQQLLVDRACTRIGLADGDVYRVSEHIRGEILDVGADSGAEEAALAGGGAVCEDVVHLGEEGGLHSGLVAAAVTVLLLVVATTAFAITITHPIGRGGRPGVVFEQLVDLVQHYHPHCE